MEKTSSGLDQNMAGALAYSLGWITGAFFLVTEPSNKFVRFHALQSIITFGGLSLAWFVTLAIPFLGWLLALVVIPVVSVGAWLLLIFKAYRGERFKLPFAGEIADQHEH
ncbi:MAG: hypothetical protein H0W08_06505 [Acidobacteria bacterium]|nr:hypothetical protein [Acidobacteriota bacterium]